MLSSKARYRLRTHALRGKALKGKALKGKLDNALRQGTEGKGTVRMRLFMNHVENYVSWGRQSSILVFLGVAG